MPRGKGRGKRGGRKTKTTQRAKDKTVEVVNLDNSLTNSDDCEIIEGDNYGEKCAQLGIDGEVLNCTTGTSQTYDYSDELKDSTASEKGLVELDEEKEIINDQEQIKKVIETSDSSKHFSKKLEGTTSFQQDNDIIIDDKDLENSITDTLSTEQTEGEEIMEARNITEKNVDISSGDNLEKTDFLQICDKKISGEHVGLGLDEITCNIANNQQETLETVVSGNQEVTLQTSGFNSKTIDETILAEMLETQNVEELESNRLEEISEGSVEKDNFSAESISDIEITGESFDPQNKKIHHNLKRQMKVFSNKQQFSTKDEFSVIKNKEAENNNTNEDISDTSLSDHTGSDISLEEISDDELEPLKRQGKSLGQISKETGRKFKERDTGNQDTRKTKIVLKNVKTDRIIAKALKYGSGDFIGNNKPTPNKRLKLEGNNEIDEVLSIGEELSYSTEDECDNTFDKETNETALKSRDTSYRKKIIPNNSILQSSSNWRQNRTEKSHESSNYFELQRRSVMVDSSCQSEPVFLKGKIVQCNINPIKLLSELYKDSALMEILSKFKSDYHSDISDAIISYICSQQPCEKGGMYSICIGPLMLSKTHSSIFNEILNATDSFSLVFANHCHGVLTATFAKRDNILSLLAWLNHQEPRHCDVAVSVFYTAKEDGGQDSLCRATLIRVRETDIQTEDKVVAEEEEHGVELYLHGLTDSVSLDFMQLLFPNAQIVSSDLGTTNRICTLLYSSSKMAKAVLASYGLLVINDSQINISLAKSLDDDQQENFLAEATQEPNRSKHSQQIQTQLMIGDIAEVLGQGDDDSLPVDMQTNLESHELVATSTDQSLTLNENISEPKSNDTFSQTKVIAKATDISNLITESKQTNLGNKDIESKQTDLSETMEFEGLHSREKTIESANHNEPCLQANESSKSEESKVVERDVKATSNRNESLTVLETIINKDNSTDQFYLSADEKQGLRVQDNNNQSVSVTDKGVSLLERAEILLENKVIDITEEEAPDKPGQGDKCDTNIDKTGKENVVYVSDDEIECHGKYEGASVIVKENNWPKEVDSDVDLTIECTMKQSDSDYIRISSDNNDEKCNIPSRKMDDNKDGSKNSTLVMTDEGLEVVMEVINASDDDDDDSDDNRKIAFPNTYYMDQHSPTSPSAFHYSSYDNKPARHSSYRDLYNESPAGFSRGHSSPLWEKSSSRKYRSRSTSPNSDLDSHTHHHKSHDSQHFKRHRDSRKMESYSKHHVKEQLSQRSPHRDPHYSKQSHDYSKHRPRSSSRKSESPENELRRSHSPISISSSTHSLSPVSRSPSERINVEKDELTRTVKHILKLAKNLKRKKRHSSRSKRQPSPVYSHHSPRNSETKRSKSPEESLSISSGSPTYSRNSRFKSKRSLSPTSHSNEPKRLHLDSSVSEKTVELCSKESGSSCNSEPEKQKQTGDSTCTEQSSKSQSWKLSSQQCKGPRKQPWQAPYAGNKFQSYRPVHPSNIYNPSLPPPRCSTQPNQSGMYRGNSTAMYQYNSQSQFNFSSLPTNVPPPFMPNIPPPRLPPRLTSIPPPRTAMPRTPISIPPPHTSAIPRTPTSIPPPRTSTIPRTPTSIPPPRTSIPPRTSTMPRTLTSIPLTPTSIPPPRTSISRTLTSVPPPRTSIPPPRTAMLRTPTSIPPPRTPIPRTPTSIPPPNHPFSQLYRPGYQMYPPRF